MGLEKFANKNRVSPLVIVIWHVFYILYNDYKLVSMFKVSNRSYNTRLPGASVNIILNKLL